MASTTEDEFNQFLDMSGMGNMGDGMQFDFHGFQDGPSQAIMAQHQHPQHQHRQQADAIMGDADPSHIIPRSDGLLQNHTPAMATTAGMQAQLLATSAPSDTISSIDAQIQYLQQQKFHQQQRQLQEQRATFFANQSHSVPPTPQSMEMPPGGGQFYSQPEQMPQRTAYDRGYHQRMSEQQDVSGVLPLPWLQIILFLVWFHFFIFFLKKEKNRQGTTFPGKAMNANVMDPTDGLHASCVPGCDAFRSPFQYGKCFYCARSLL